VWIVLALQVVWYALQAGGVQEAESRLYSFRKCGGSGCPYAASWLANVNFYRKIPWWLDSTKMEAASFNM
jgi:hypothetical protein